MRVVEEDDLPLVRQVLQAQEYWRLKGLRADVVILNEHPVGYLDEMQAQLDGAARQRAVAGVEASAGRRLPAARRAHGARPSAVLLAAVARAVLSGDRGELAHAARPAYARAGPRPSRRRSSRRGRRAGRRRGATPLERPARLDARQRPGRLRRRRARVRRSSSTATEETPLPWANVIANPQFGTVVTASGSAYTWSENSRENRLTPFANDPVSDPTAEALFVRDDETGEAWSPTPGPDAAPPRATAGA